MNLSGQSNWMDQADGEMKRRSWFGGQIRWQKWQMSLSFSSKFDIPVGHAEEVAEQMNLKFKVFAKSTNSAGQRNSYVHIPHITFLGYVKGNKQGWGKL